MKTAFPLNILAEKNNLIQNLINQLSGKPKYLLWAKGMSDWKKNHMRK